MIFKSAPKSQISTDLTQMEHAVLTEMAFLEQFVADIPQIERPPLTQMGLTAGKRRGNLRYRPPAAPGGETAPKGACPCPSL